MLMTTEDTMSRREAAMYLGVHYNTIRGYEERGLLRPQRVTVGGVEEVHYARDEIEKLVEQVPRYRRGNARPDTLAPERSALLSLEQQVSSLRAQIAALREMLEDKDRQIASLRDERTDLLQTVKDIATGKR